MQRLGTPQECLPLQSRRGTWSLGVSITLSVRSHGSGTSDGKGQPPEGLTWFPVNVALPPPFWIASGRTFSKQLERIVVPKPALWWTKMPEVYGRASIIVFPSIKELPEEPDGTSITEREQ